MKLFEEIFVKGFKWYYQFLLIRAKRGRNQALNLAKQKYEILTGHKNRCS